MDVKSVNTEDFLFLHRAFILPLLIRNFDKEIQKIGEELLSDEMRNEMCEFEGSLKKIKTLQELGKNITNNILSPFTATFFHELESNSDIEKTINKNILKIVETIEKMNSEIIENFFKKNKEVLSKATQSVNETFNSSVNELKSNF